MKGKVIICNAEIEDLCDNCCIYPAEVKDYRDFGDMCKFEVCIYCFNLNDRWFLKVGKANHSGLGKVDPKKILEDDIEEIKLLEDILNDLKKREKKRKGQNKKCKVKM